jgi:hypothetical protein
MSWAGLANNQTVSFNNLQNAVSTGVFIAKTSIPASNEQITKADANTYVYLNTGYAPYSGKASNQLVVKSNLQPVGSEARLEFNSGSNRICQLKLFSDGVRIDDDQIVAISSGCEGDVRNRPVNPITIPGVVVQIVFGTSNISDTYNYNFKILDNPGRTTVFADIQSTVTVPPEGSIINLRPPLLTVGNNYFYELIANSTSCPL